MDLTSLGNIKVIDGRLFIDDEDANFPGILEEDAVEITQINGEYCINKRRLVDGVWVQLGRDEYKPRRCKYIAISSKN